MPSVQALTSAATASATTPLRRSSYTVCWPACSCRRPCGCSMRTLPRRQVTRTWPSVLRTSRRAAPSSATRQPGPANSARRVPAAASIAACPCTSSKPSPCASLRRRRLLCVSSSIFRCGVGAISSRSPVPVWKSAVIAVTEGHKPNGGCSAATTARLAGAATAAPRNARRLQRCTGVAACGWRAAAGSCSPARRTCSHCRFARAKACRWPGSASHHWRNFLPSAAVASPEVNRTTHAWAWRSTASSGRCG